MNELTTAALLNLALFGALVAGAVVLVMLRIYETRNDIHHDAGYQHALLIRVGLLLLVIDGMGVLGVLTDADGREWIRLGLLVVRGFALTIIWALVFFDASRLRKYRGTHG